MHQGRTVVDAGVSTGHIARLSIKAVCRRGGALLVLGALVWVAWSRRGAEVGIPEAIGFAPAALRVVAGHSSGWAARHGLKDDIVWYLFIEACWLWAASWDTSRQEAGALLLGGALFAVSLPLLDWWRRRKRARAARRVVLTALAADFQRLIALRSTDTGE